MATFCLLHGKWHDGSSWKPLMPLLEQRGHSCLTPELPFDDPSAGHWERAQPAVEALAGAHQPVVVVGHSLAAAVTPLVAVKGSAAQVVYLCPAPAGPFAAVDVGVAPIREGFPFPPDREDGSSVWDREAAMAAMYPRLPDETARAMAARLRPGAYMPDPYPLDVHPDVPAALVAGCEDEFFTLEWYRRIAAAVLDEEAIEISSGHFPMVEVPGELADALDMCAP